MALYSGKAMFSKKTRRHVGILVAALCGTFGIVAHAQAIEASSFMAPIQLATTNTIIPVKWEAVPVTTPNTNNSKQGTNSVGTNNNSVVVGGSATKAPDTAITSMANSAKASAVSGGSVTGVSVLFFQMGGGNPPPPPVSCSKPGNGHGHGHGCDDDHGHPPHNPR
jgi:hypothetical protein